MQTESEELNQVLLDKYQHLKAFREQMNKNQQRYGDLLRGTFDNRNISIHNDMFVKLSTSDKDLYIFYAFMYDPLKMSVQDLTKFITYKFTPKPTKNYYFIFMNHNSTNWAYRDIKNIFLGLTLDHYRNLKNFILIQPSIYNKMLDLFTYNPLANLLKQKTIYMDSCKELCYFLKIDLQTLYRILPETISVQQFPRLQRQKKMIIKPQSIAQRKMLYQSLQNKDKNKMKFLTSFTFEIDDYEMSKNGIPLFIEILLFYFTLYPQKLKQQGLFRKSASIEQQRKIMQELSQQNYDYLLKIETCHIIASLIKKFFRGLKYPLINYEQFYRLMAYEGQNMEYFVKQAVEALPLINYITLVELFRFLKEKVQPLATQTKMSANSLSIVFAPCIMRPQQSNQNVFLYAQKSAKICRIMLEHYEKIFGNKKIQQNQNYNNEKSLSNNRRLINQNKSAQNYKQQKQNQALPKIKSVRNLNKMAKSQIFSISDESEIQMKQKVRNKADTERDSSMNTIESNFYKKWKKDQKKKKMTQSGIEDPRQASSKPQLRQIKIKRGPEKLDENRETLQGLGITQQLYLMRNKKQTISTEKKTKKQK